MDVKELSPYYCMYALSLFIVMHGLAVADAWESKFIRPRRYMLVASVFPFCGTPSTPSSLLIGQVRALWHSFFISGKGRTAKAA
jgi:hypothetical protein